MGKKLDSRDFQLTESGGLLAYFRGTELRVLVLYGVTDWNLVVEGQIGGTKEYLGVWLWACYLVLGIIILGSKVYLG